MQFITRSSNINGLRGSKHGMALTSYVLQKAGYSDKAKRVYADLKTQANFKGMLFSCAFITTQLLVIFWYLECEMKLEEFEFSNTQTRKLFWFRQIFVLAKQRQSGIQTKTELAVSKSESKTNWHWNVSVRITVSCRKEGHVTGHKNSELACLPTESPRRLFINTGTIERTRCA